MTDLEKLTRVFDEVGIPWHQRFGPDGRSIVIDEDAAGPPGYLPLFVFDHEGNYENSGATVDSV